MVVAAKTANRIRMSSSNPLSNQLRCFNVCQPPGPVVVTIITGHIPQLSVKHVAVMGSKKSGKTFVAAYLVERFSRDGYRVAAVKHIHHEFTIDTEGKDTWKMARSGAEIVASVSPNETAVLLYNSRIWSSNLLRLTEFLEREGIEVAVYEGFHNLLGKSPNVYKIITMKENSDAEMLKSLAPPFLAVFRREASLWPETGLPVFGPELSDEFYHHVKEKLGMG